MTVEIGVYSNQTLSGLPERSRMGWRLLLLVLRPLTSDFRP
jgi:hypothetical protein